MSDAVTPLLSIDRKAPRPLHRQIYDAYRDAILSGSLRPGQRVPSTRSLASDLGVSRIPVLGAYAQLMAEGYFQSRRGSGTSVSLSLPDQSVTADGRGVRSPRIRGNPFDRKVAQQAPAAIFPQNPPWQRPWGAFGIGQVASQEFPFRVWHRLVARHCRNQASRSLDYGEPMGLKSLREALASYLRTARGVRCEPEQVIIVSGSQQALDITTRVLLAPGSRIWVENPGYRYARQVFALNGCRLVPVPVDPEGLNVEAGVKCGRDAHAVLVTPSHQYPLGVTLSASRRLQLLDWAARRGGWILEDDYDSEYRYEGMPIPALQGLDSNSRVVYIGTFSKVLFPALRLGYLVVPRDLRERFLRVRLAMDIAPATFSQGVLADFIHEGHFSRHLRRMRILYRERRNALVSAIENQFGPAVAITGEQAGMHLCVLADGVDDRRIVDRAVRAGLCLMALSTSYLGKSRRRGFVLGFASTPATQMPGAVRRLRSLWQEEKARGRSRIGG